MRYLYADSEEFPHDYDFLATLKGFMACVGRALESLSELERAEQQLSERSVSTAQKLDALNAFADRLGEAIERTVEEAPNRALAEEVVRETREFVTQHVRQMKASLDEEMKGLHSGTTKEIDEHREAIQEAFSEFLTEHHHDLASPRYELRLEEGLYRARVVAAVLPDVQVRYRLKPGEVEAWSQPRRVEDVAGPVMVQVGMKKKLLSREMTREITQASDLYIGGVELGPDVFEVRLRRRPDAEDNLVIRKEPEGGEQSYSIVRKGEDERTFPASDTDRSTLDHLRQSIEAALHETLAHRERAESVYLGGESVFRGMLVVPLIERFVAAYEPIVAEIARRSPTPHELSLKRELEDGLREEIYVRKAELAELVSHLDENKVSVLGSLDAFPEVRLEVD